MAGGIQHIPQLSDKFGSVANYEPHYIEFYGWVYPQGASLQATEPISAVDVFGVDSYLSVGSVGGATSSLQMLNDNLGYQIIVIGLFFLYFFVFLRFGVEIIQHLKLVFSGGNNRDRRAESDSMGLEVSLEIALCGLTAFSVAVLKILSLRGGAFAEFLLSSASSAILILIASAIVLTVLAVQRMVLKIIGFITFNTFFVRTLDNLRRSVLITSTIFITPIVLFFALSYGVWADIFVWLFIFMIIFLFVVYIVKSFLLFVSQKVSILFWILYLCTVEMMPFALIVTSIIKYTTH